MLRSTLFSFALAGAFVSAAWAEQAKPPADLAKIRGAFAAAVSSNKVSDAAALTHFPLKNTVFHAPPTVSRASFGKLFANYREMQACLNTEPLEKDGASWVINCDGNVLHFGLRGGRWMHTEYENINE